MGGPVVVVGFDLGTNLGWADLVDGDRAASGQVHLGSGRGRWKAAAELFDARITEATWEFSEACVVYESVKFFRNTPQWSAVYHGLRAILELTTIEAGVPCYALGSMEWKKTAVGKGNASKPEYVAAANERYGLELALEDEDEAAALGVAYAAYVRLGGAPRLLRGQQEALKL